MVTSVCKSTFLFIIHNRKLIIAGPLIKQSMNPTRHSNILIPKFLISTTFPVNADISKSFFDDKLIKLNISSLKLKKNLKNLKLFLIFVLTKGKVYDRIKP